MVRFERRYRTRLWLALVLLALGGCWDGESGATVIPDGESFRIEPFEEGPCSFDERTELVRVDASGSVLWELATPFSWSNRLLVHDRIGVLEVETGAVGFDVGSGAPLWQFEDDENGRTLLLSSVVGLVDPAGQRVLGLDPSSGGELWEYDSERVIAQGGATDGSSLFLNVDGTIVALDGTSGTPLWERETIGDASYPPQLVDGLLLYPAFEGRLYRLDPESGQVVWHWATGDSAVALTDSIDVSAGVVLVTTTGWSGPAGLLEPPLDAARLVGLDVGSGDVLWTRNLAEPELGFEGAQTPGALVYSGQGLALIHRPLAGLVEAVDIDSGAALWEYETPSADVFDASGGAGVLYMGFGSRLGGEAQVHAVRAEDGIASWTMAIDYASALSVRPIGEGLYAFFARYDDSTDLTKDLRGAMSRLDPDTGQQLWSIDTREGIQHVIEQGGQLLAVTSDPSYGCA